MTARDEGVIHFNCVWEKAPALPSDSVRNLIKYRQRLFQMGLIGVYPDGIGYGNLSQRGALPGQFVISGSQTGHLPQLSSEHFALVTGYSIAENKICCLGPLKASSESLTHAMIYETFQDAEAILHIHSPDLWKKWKNSVPTTGEKIPYGTPAMAEEIKRLSLQSDLKSKKILVMAGHEDGVITFGKSLDEAGSTLMVYFEGARSSSQ